MTDIAARPFEWTKSSTSYLIEVLKKHPCLWNVKSKEYKMRNLRSASCESVREKLAAVNCIVQNADIIKKIHTLKTQFHREIAAVKASKKSGVGTEEVYNPKLWCFKDLHFLAEGCTIRASTSNLDVETTEHEHGGDVPSSICASSSEDGITSIPPDEVVTVPSNETVNEDSYSQETPLLVSTQSPVPTPGPSPSPSTSASSSGISKRKRNKNDQLDNVMEIALQTLSGLPSRAPQNKALSSFSQYIYDEMNDMREDQVKIVKLLMFHVLNLGCSEKLTTDHQVVQVQGANEFMT